MKAARLLSATAAAVMLAGCSASGDGVWNSSGSRDISFAVTSRAEEKIPELDRRDVELSLASDYFFELIEDKNVRTAMLLMLKGMREHTGTVDLKGLSVRDDDIKDLFDLLLCCEPGLAWVDYNYEVTADTLGNVLSVNIRYKLDKAAAAKASEELRKAVKEIVSAAEGMDDFERMLYFHDTVISSCEYDRSGSNAWSAYGCLVEGRAVCEGYSKALIALCDEAGVLCLPVSGTGSRDITELHMWNKVQMDGEWYNMDLTWDDPTPGDDAPAEGGAGRYDFLHRDYFGQTDAKASADHAASGTKFLKYPEAAADKDNYFIHTGRYIDSADSAEDIIYASAVKSLGEGESIFQLAFSDSGVYDLFYQNELDGGGIFNVLSRLANEGWPVSAMSYEFVPNKEQQVITLIMKKEL